jgi:hypothetical protein
MGKTLILSLGLVLGVSWHVMGQEVATPFYFFEGEDIVFEFDVNLHKNLTEEESGKKLDFDDLEIYDVAISGEFNNWSREGWKMKKVGEGLYQLRKKVADFNDDFEWQFKFFVNGKYWAEPMPGGNLVKIHDNLFWEEVFNVRLYNIVPNPEGNAYFFLEGFPDANKIVLSGSFNGWHEYMLPMVQTHKGWEMQIQLDPGYYEYKFIVDGEWIEDPSNPRTVVNVHGTLNSVLEVTKPVTFRINGYLNAEQVMLAGSFNDWKPDQLQMERMDGGWEYTLNLVGGKHYYKFIVDGDWMVDPQNTILEGDGHGNVNSVIMVQ